MRVSGGEREEALTSLLDVLERIDKTRSRVQNFKRERVPGTAHALDLEKELAEHRDRLRKYAQGVQEFEEKLFAAYNENATVYVNRVLEKKSELLDALRAAQEEESTYLTKFRRQHGVAHIRVALRSLGPSDLASVLKGVIRIQANYRRKIVRKTFTRTCKAVVLIQVMTRKFLKSRRPVVVLELPFEPRVEMRQQRTSITLTPRGKQLFIASVIRIQKWRRKLTSRRDQLDPTSKLQLAAAIRFRSVRLTQIVLRAWCTYTQTCTKGKQKMRLILDKYVNEPLAYAFKVWWASSRTTYRVKKVAGYEVLVRDRGAALPCIHLHNGHFFRSPDTRASLPTFIEGGWRDWTLLRGGESLRKGSPKSARAKSPPRSPLVGAARAVLSGSRVSCDGPAETYVNPDWSLPHSIAKSKKDFLERRTCDEDRRLFKHLVRSHREEVDVPVLESGASEIVDQLLEWKKKHPSASWSAQRSNQREMPS